MRSPPACPFSCINLVFWIKQNEQKSSEFVKSFRGVITGVTRQMSWTINFLLIVKMLYCTICVINQCLSVNCFSSSGEVSDSESNSSSSSSDSDSSEDEVFKDGYDDDLMGDAEDRARLEQMTEKEREQELFNRIEKREVLKRRWVLMMGGGSRYTLPNLFCVLRII